MNIGVVFGQMLVLFAMMVVGFFCYKKMWITDETSGHLSKLVVNVFNPILVVNGVLGQNSKEAGDGVAWNILFIVIYFVLLLLIGYLLPLLLRPSEHLKSVYRLMTIFSNVGFMGIPVIRSIFGNEAMIYVAFYILAYNIMLYTCGMHLARKAGEENRRHEMSEQNFIGKQKEEVLSDVSEEQVVRAMLSYQNTPEKKTSFFKQMLNPGVIAALLAVVIFAAGIKVWEPIGTFCDYMGNTTIPLSMLLIGVSVAQADIKELFADWRIYAFVLLRMIVLPVSMVFLFRGIVTAYAVSSMVFGVFIIELGMPVGSIIALMAREKGADAAYCTRGVVISTLASIITIPLICAFL